MIYSQVNFHSLSDIIEIDIDTETDETDCEVIIELENDDNESISEKKDELLQQDEISLELRYESYLSGNI